MCKRLQAGRATTAIKKGGSQETRRQSTGDETTRATLINQLSAVFSEMYRAEAGRMLSYHSTETARLSIREKVNK